MKLPIRKKYFDLILSGEKGVEFRDAHITFVCEETGRTLRREVTHTEVLPIEALPVNQENDGMFEDNYFIYFVLSEKDDRD